MEEYEEKRADWMIVFFSVAISIIVMRISFFLIDIVDIYFGFLPGICIWFVKTNCFSFIISLCCAIYVVRILKDKSYKTNMNVLIILVILAIIPIHIKIGSNPVLINGRNNQIEVIYDQDISGVNITCKLMDKGKKYKPLICFLGSLTWWQGVDLLAKAVVLLVKRYSTPVKLLIIGDGPLRSEISRILKLTNVEFEITGFLPHIEALKLLGKSDVLVVPRKYSSITESCIPIKVIEAWALGVPVIITKHKILLTMGLKNMEHVMYCQPDPQSIAQSILSILNDAKLRNALSCSGLRVAQNFDYDTLAQRIVQCAS